MTHRTDQPGVPTARRLPLPRWTVPVVAVTVLAVAVAIGVLLWSWIDGSAMPGAKDRAVALLDVVKVAASVAVGGGGVFALYLAVRRQRTQELELEARHLELTMRAEAQQATDADAEARRITELYSKSAEQLGSDKAPVRLAGLYALERLAQDNPGQRQTAVNVLCAYLRMPYMSPGDVPDDDADEAVHARHHDRVQERQVRLTVQRILVTHLHPGTEPDFSAGTFWADLDVDLTDATLVDFDLTGCRVRNGRFERADFLGHTEFVETEFAENAVFSAANFHGDVRFEMATVGGSAAFVATTFGGEAWFLDARVTGNAWFTKARFGGITVLGDAEFGGNVRLTGATFDNSYANGSTWPSGWRVSQHLVSGAIEDSYETWYLLDDGDPE